MKIKKKNITWVVVLAVCTVITGAYAQDVRLGGYYKNYTQAYHCDSGLSASIGSGGATAAQALYGSQHNYVRTGVKLIMSYALSMEAAYRVGVRIDPSFSALLLSPQNANAYRIADLPSRIYPEQENRHNIYLSQNLDRLSITLRPSWGDIILGRQAISWGSARVHNPTNVIMPYSFDALDKEEAAGVDAARVRIPLGTMNEIDLGYISGPGAAPDSSAAFLRTRFYAGQTDFSMLAMLAKTHALAGIDIARSLGGAGIYAEAAYTMTHLGASSVRDAANDYLRLSCGIDYHFPIEVYLFGEYHYNGAGSCTPDDYLYNYYGYENLDDVLTRLSLSTAALADSGAVAEAFGNLRSVNPAYRDMGVYLLGVHYLSAGGNYQLTPLMRLNILGVLNLCDASLSVSPRIEYNIAGDIYIDAGLYLNTGHSPEPVDIDTVVSNPLSDPSPALEDLYPRVRSEFGLSPDLYFASVRVYF